MKNLALTILSIFLFGISSYGEGMLMTIEGNNLDKNTSVGLVVKMTSPSGKHERFKEAAMGSNIWQYELKEKGTYTIEASFLILENGKIKSEK